MQKVSHWFAQLSMEEQHKIMQNFILKYGDKQNWIFHLTQEQAVNCQTTKYENL